METARVPPSRGEEATSVKECGAPACFDCNICLEPVAEPVVTLCGHLYCRPCVRLWLRSGQPGHGQCPVCKATVSEDRLVRLYGRGHATASCQDDGDGLCLDDVQQSTYGFRNQQERRHGASMDDNHVQSWVLHSNAGSVIGSVAMAALPWAFPDGQFPPRSVLPYGGRRQRRVEDSLHQIWLFLAVFALLCFLLF